MLKCGCRPLLMLPCCMHIHPGPNACINTTTIIIIIIPKRKHTLHNKNKSSQVGGTLPGQKYQLPWQEVTNGKCTKIVQCM